MNILDIDTEVGCLLAEEERILASFTRRLDEITAIAAARGLSTSPTVALNAMNLPTIALDWRGFVVDVTEAADEVFDDDFKIKDNKRLFIRDPEAREFLKEALKQLRTPRLIPLALKPFVVQRRGQLPVVVRIWPFAGPAHLPLRPIVSPILAILNVVPTLIAPRQSRYTN